MDGIMRVENSRALMDYLRAPQWSRDERMAAVALPFYEAAQAVVGRFRHNAETHPEMDECLRKLLEAQGWALRHAQRVADDAHERIGGEG